MIPCVPFSFRFWAGFYQVIGKLTSTFRRHVGFSGFVPSLPSRNAETRELRGNWRTTWRPCEYLVCDSRNPKTLCSFHKSVCFAVICKFWVILGDFWQEIVFLKGLVKFGEIRNISSHNRGWRPQRGTLYYSARYPMWSTFQAIFNTNCAILTKQKTRVTNFVI